jgi:hypothetical protein
LFAPAAPFSLGGTAGKAGKNRGRNKPEAKAEAVTDGLLPSYEDEKKDQLLQPGGSCLSGIAERARSPELPGLPARHF